MLGQLTDERVTYRCRRTVLEMLKDRGYDIGDPEIEESFEDFETRLATLKSVNIIAKRPTGKFNSAVLDEAGNPKPMMEPIFVAFAPDDKLGQEAFKSLLAYMSKWSDETTRDPCVTDMLNAILVVKGASSQIFRKVSGTHTLTNSSNRQEAMTSQNMAI